MLTPFRYHGNQNAYVDIAVRGTDHLGIGLTYAKTNQASVVIVRFVVRSEGKGHVGDFQHFDLREAAKFFALSESGETTMQPLFGARLNKVLVKVFAERVPVTNLAALGDAHGLWEKLAVWIQAQATADGFAVEYTPQELTTIVRNEIIPAVDSSKIALSMEYPDLVAFKAMKVTQMAAASDDDEDEHDDDAPGETIN